MTFVDKYNLLEERLARGSLSLELGVGSRKLCDDAIGIDLIDSPACDIVGDVREILNFLPECSVSHVYASHFVEHIEHVKDFLESLVRVCTPNAQIILIVPHYSNPFFHSDPTHRATYGLYTFAYYASTSILSKTIPSYSRIKCLELVEVYLTFKSYPPNFGRHFLKKILEVFVNVSYWTKELYEEIFCWIAPCYDIKYVLIVRK